ncbi:MAG: HAD-IA family hydrolase, partial [Rubricoccaceae bacterium]|nr:HAD-IA family hydrolase [Rubricoccaceae bacterium]
MLSPKSEILRTKIKAPISFVYFDLDDTLLDHRKAEKTALADCHNHFSEHLGHLELKHIQETYHRHNVPLWRDYGRGLITKADLKRLRFEHLLTALEIDLGHAHTIGEHYLNRYAHHWSWIDGAEQAFLDIAERFPVGILTNGFAEIQQAKLDTFPLLAERASSIVISENVGVMKPNRALFDHAANAAGVEPEEILYIGDSLHSDVIGGRNAGWQVAWFRGDSSVRGDV